MNWVFNLTCMSVSVFLLRITLDMPIDGVYTEIFSRPSALNLRPTRRRQFCAHPNEIVFSESVPQITLDLSSVTIREFHKRNYNIVFWEMDKRTLVVLPVFGW